MSRDWRPCELYMADVDMEHKLRSPMTMYNEKNEVVRVIQGNDYLKSNYGNIYFLMDGFEQLYENISSKKHHKDALKFLSKVNDIVTDLGREIEEVTDRVQAQALYEKAEVITEDISSHSVEDVARSWFYGKLTDRFYYNIENNDNFYDYLKEVCNKTIEKERNKKLEKDR